MSNKTIDEVTFFLFFLKWLQNNSKNLIAAYKLNSCLEIMHTSKKSNVAKKECIQINSIKLTKFSKYSFNLITIHSTWLLNQKHSVRILVYVTTRSFESITTRVF